VLAIVNDITRERIAGIATLKSNKAAKAVLPPDVGAIEQRKDPSDAKTTMFAAYADAAKTKLIGYAVPGRSGSGYAGEIRLMVGLTPERKVISYQVLAANETPGLGSKLGDAVFSGQFGGKSGIALKVKKDGGEIDAITGATITSRAVCEAIADACARVDRTEGKTPAAAPAAPPANPEGKMLFDPSDPKEALKTLPGNTATIVARSKDRFPIFEGKDASGKTTGYAVVGTGRARGPNGELVLHYLFGFKPTRAPSFAPPPRLANQPGVEITDMEEAQRTAYNGAMRDAMTRLMKLPR
jgi:electron transport complex protein RnfG